MGFFDRRDRKRRGHVDDFASPVEEIDLDSFGPMPGAEPSHYAAAAANVEPAPHYGVDQAMQLLQSLPADNLELAVQIVKQTLASMNIRIGPIIEEAGARLDYAQHRSAQLVDEIAQFERGIEERRAELARLASDFESVTTVRDRLLMAERANLSEAPVETATVPAVNEQAPTAPSAAPTAPSAAPTAPSAAPTAPSAAPTARATTATRAETVDPEPDVVEETVGVAPPRQGRPSTPPPIPRSQVLPSIRGNNQAAGDK